MRVDPQEFENESYDSGRGRSRRDMKANKISINMIDEENKGDGKYFNFLFQVKVVTKFHLQQEIWAVQIRKRIIREPRRQRKRNNQKIYI